MKWCWWAGAGVGCDHVIAPKCCLTWGKLRKLLPVLTTKHLSPKIRGKVYEAGVSSAMLHGSETWGLNTIDLLRLRHSDRAMICWIFGTKVRDERPLASLLQRLGWGCYGIPSHLATQMVWTCTACLVMYQISHRPSDSQLKRARKA